jgi:hypothetical protein
MAHVKKGIDCFIAKSSAVTGLSDMALKQRSPQALTRKSVSLNLQSFTANDDVPT